VARQPVMWHASGERLVENALEIARLLVLVVLGATLKKRVGGICRGSPTTMQCLPRAIAPIASGTVIWLASSKSYAGFWVTKLVRRRCEPAFR
jgi:hypothetical protein